MNSRAVRLWVFVCLAVIMAAPALSREGVRERLHVDAAVRGYTAGLKALGFTPDELCVHSIGQSHIDAAWRWRKAQTHDKVYDTWSQAVGYMDHDPEFKFSGSAPQYYEWIMQDHPDVFDKIVKYEKQGQWEIVGGQWVEPDGNMPDGESFVRQRLEGQRFYLTHFGHISQVGWMLDSFGYHHNMPQIMARSGAKYMWTSKLTWNDTTIFPFHNFIWRAPDGSEVLTHICPTSGGPMFFPFDELGKYKGTRYLVKPGVELVAGYATPREQIEQALSTDWVNEIGIFYGKGDGGRGPTPTEVAVQEAFADKGYSKITTGLALFHDLDKYSARMPVWDDEMYLEYHRGVQTSQAWIKRANRLAEQTLRTVETLRSMLQQFGLEYPYERLKETWKLMLLQQFHDILPGSSIPQVYEDARQDFKTIEAAVAEARITGLKKLAAMADTSAKKAGLEPVVVFNPLGWDRDGMASLEVKDNGNYVVTDESGEVMPSQVVERGGMRVLAWRAEGVPSIGYKVYFLDKSGTAAKTKSSPSIIDSSGSIVLENALVKVTLNKSDGTIASMLDKRSGKEMLSGPSNKLLGFRDDPDRYSAWNIDPDYQKHPLDLSAAPEVKVSMDGPLFVEALVRREVKQGGKTTVFEQRVRLAADDPVVYLDLDSDFHMEYALIKDEFNTVIKADKVAADGPYLVLEHPTHPEQPAQKAMWELICHKWVDLSDGTQGLALLNNGKYGYSLTADGKGIRLSMIKGARYTRPAPEAVNVTESEKMWPGQTGFTDQGAHHAELGLLAHAGGWRDAKLWRAGYDFNTPLEAVRAEAHSGALGTEGSFFAINSKSTYIGSIKRAEDDDDIVVRLVEAAGERDTATLKAGRGMRIVSGEETDLLELNPEAVDVSGSSVRVDMGPFEVRTLKLKVIK